MGRGRIEYEPEVEDDEDDSPAVGEGNIDMGSIANMAMNPMSLISSAATGAFKEVFSQSGLNQNPAAQVDAKKRARMEAAILRAKAAREMQRIKEAEDKALLDAAGKDKWKAYAWGGGIVAAVFLAAKVLR